MNSILICDDHAVFRLGIRVLLENDPAGYKIIETENGPDAVTLALEKRPQLIIIDYLIPGFNGLEAIEQIRREYFEIKTILLTNVEERVVLEKCSSIGVNGCLFKSEPLETIRTAVHDVLSGKTFYSDFNPRTEEHKAGAESPFKSLTAREIEIVQRIARGMIQSQIARELGISVRTIEKHRSNITEKIGKMTSAELTRQAYIWGLISDTGLFSSYN